MRILHTPWLFRLPWFRRFHGYTMWPLILLRQPLAEVPDDLIVHELFAAYIAPHLHAEPARLKELEDSI